VTTEAPRCPACRGTLTAKRVGAVDVESCTRCSAAWFPASALESLIKVLDGRRTPSGLHFHEDGLGRGSPTTYRCPTDGTVLGAAYWGDAQLARCNDCGGIWITEYMLGTIRAHLAAAPRADPEDALTLIDVLDLFSP
jgi:Zn-finger nucleic acid-binding protein